MNSLFGTHCANSEGYNQMLAVRVFFSMVTKKKQDIAGGKRMGIERRCKNGNITYCNIKYGNIKNGNQHKRWKYQTHLNRGNQEIIYLSGLALSKTKVP